MASKIKPGVMSLFFILPYAALANDAPTFDCAKATSSAEKLICSDPDLARLDNRMAARFDAAVAVAKGLDTDAEATEKTLRARQRGWIKGRDECWKEADLRACIQYEYLSREGRLVAEFLLEEPEKLENYTCGPSAPDMTLYRFNTELPSLRVERGDDVWVGAQASPEDHALFYLRDAGAIEFGEATATLTDPYGNATACKLKP